jgi:ABC-2 type transport system ATP-binding protein
MVKTSTLAIKTTHISKSYGNNQSLKSLDLQITAGEIFGLLGHNGAGKTTIVNILTTLLQPTSGTAEIFGYDIQKESQQARKLLGYLPENVRFYDNMTAYENVEYLAKLSGMSTPKKRILEVFEYLDFTEHMHQRVGEFSKGMRQRVGIAQAIVHKPKLLFLDEPTSGLDPEGVKQLRDLIIRLNRDENMTIFMNTHLLSEVAKTCTSIGVLNHGKLIYKDSLANTMKRFPSEASLEDIYTTVESSTV